ncbi:uncharacterized protein [Periplaneta americana]
MSILDFDFPLLIPMRAAIQVYFRNDVSTFIIEFFIIGIASLLAYLLIKVSNNNCKTVLEKVNEVMSELDTKMETLDINSRFVNNTLGLAEKTCNSYNELLYIMNLNKMQDDGVFTLINSAMSKRLTSEVMKSDIQRSKEMLERVNLAITESELEL